MTSLDPDKPIQQLLDWHTAHGGRVHAAVEIFWDATTGMSLRVRRGAQLAPGEAAVYCPLQTTLSYLNVLANGPLGTAHSAASSDLALPPAFVRETPPHVLGRYCLMQQYLLGPASHWHPYIALLPPPDSVAAWVLPALWSAEATAPEDLLVGTNAGIAAAEMRATLEREYAAAQQALTAAGFDAAVFSPRLYHWAYCIFTSRSFRPSLVLSPADQAVLRGAAAGPEQGPEQEHSRRPWTMPTLPAACQMDDFSILLPVLDLGNHDPTARVTWEPGAAGEATPGVAFCVQQSYGSGAQVFNHYGHKTNSELLLGYGFVLPPTAALHNDYVHLRKRTAVQPTAARPEHADFLLALRPLDDPSSVVGAARQWPRPAGATLVPAYSRFEDALLWDLCTQLLTAEDVAALALAQAPATATERTAVLDRVLATPVDGPLAALEERMRETLFAKAAGDYERFVAGEVEDEDEEDDDDREESRRLDRHCRKLAMTYRRQYGTVLVAALQALDPGLELVEA